MTMTHLADLYPGHLVVDHVVIVAKAVTLASAAAWIVSSFLERHPAVRYWVLLSALLASLAIPIFSAAFILSGTSFVVVPLLRAEKSPIGVLEARDGQRPSGELSPMAAKNLLPANSPDPVVAAPSPNNLAATQVASAAFDLYRSTAVAVLLLWLCGTVVSILGLARNALFLHRLRRSLQPVSDAELLEAALDDAKQRLGTRTSPTVMVSRLARTPMVTGLFRPVIVLPVELPRAISREQLCDVLMHELAHVERRDTLIVLLQAFTNAFFWPVLFVHLVNRQLERAREDICDNHVLACRDAVTYGETLLRVAQ
jgi:Zn-dependent protease with chaperone function